MSKLDDRLAALANMSPAQLRGEWLQLFREAAPPVGHRLLALAIAYRLQEKVYGGLPPAVGRELERVAKSLAKNGTLPAEATATLKVGTRLVREWRGTPHHVHILEEGYVYQDQRYRSLSHIARAITGTNWSGPRFFGLNSKSATTGRASHVAA